jgi:D-lactate dehydrogenase (cytochrome)
LARQLIHPLTETYQDYLTDESRLEGAADSISFPESEAEIGTILQVMRKNRMPVTIQGGKTGVVGSAVPAGGHIMNLSRMNQVKSFLAAGQGEAYLKVEPGVTLNELRRAIDRLKTPRAFFWPPDPSETTATVGGVAATAATGRCFHLYGKSASYVAGIRVINSEGSMRDLKRGHGAMVIDGESQDLLDVYLGGEGMYGVITELTLRLIPKPAEIWGIGFFFEDREDGMSFSDQLGTASIEAQGADIAAIEYLDRTIIKALEMHKRNMAGLKPIADMTPPVSAMVYVEIHGDQQDAIEAMAESIVAIGSRFNVDPEKSWAFSGAPEVDKVGDFLHAAAETAILQIAKARSEDPRITKLGLDFSLEGEGLKIWVGRIEKTLQQKNLKAVYWGHIGSNRLHIDIQPESYEEFVTGQALLETWAERFPAAVGGAIGSYGIGKLKKSIFCKTASKAYIEALRRLKQRLDKHNRWNPGNMIEVE